MAIHEIQAPDGQIHQVEAPADASAEQVMSFFQQSYKPAGNFMGIDAGAIANNIKAQQPSEFTQNSIDNFKGGIQAGKDLVSGDYWKQLGNNLSEGVSNIADIATNPQLRQDFANQNFKRTDYTDALSNGFNQSPSGKIFGAVGGTVLNTPSTIIGNYANPAIAKATGLSPNEVGLIEMAAPGASKLVPEGVKSVVSNAASKAGNFVGDVGKTIKMNYDNSPLSDNRGGSFGKANISATPEQVQVLKNHIYTKAESEGGILKPDIINQAISKAESVAPRTPEGKAFAGNNETTRTVNDLQGLKDKPLSLAAYEEIDKDLTNRISKETDIKGNYTPDGKNIAQIQSHLRDAAISGGEGDMVNGQGFASYNQARQIAATKFRMDDVQSIFDKANLSDNPQLVIKNGFARLVSKGQRGFTDAEWADVNKAAKTGLAAGALKLGGSRLLSGIAGFGAGGIPGAIAAEGVAYGLRKAGAGLQAAPGKALMNKLGSRPAVLDAIRNLTPEDLAKLPPEQGLQVLQDAFQQRKNAALIKQKNNVK